MKKVYTPKNPALDFIKLLQKEIRILKERNKDSINENKDLVRRYKVLLEENSFLRNRIESEVAVENKRALDAARLKRVCDIAYRCGVGG